MQTIEKLVNNIWINYHPKSSLFTLELLHDQGSGFILDLSDVNDLEEFDELMKLFSHTIDKFELENSSSTLELEWYQGHVIFTHDTMMIANPFNNPIDIFNHQDVEHLLEVLKRIYKLT